MRFRSLAIRIVVIFLAMSLLGQLAGFFVIKKAINENARTALNDELTVGEYVASRFIEQNAHKLALGASLIANDPSLARALRDGDVDTQISILSVGSKRIGSASIMAVDAAGKPIVQSGSAVSELFGLAIKPMLKMGTTIGTSSSVIVLSGQIFQVAVSPIRSPVIDTNYWLVVASPISLTTAREIGRTAGVHVSLVVATNTLHSVASTLPEDVATGLVTSALSKSREPGSIKLQAGEFGTREVLLTNINEERAYMVLSRSISAAVEPYSMLQLTLLILTVSNIIIIVAGSIFTARKITGPIRNLSMIAQRLGNGNFSDHIEIKSDDEIGDLSRAFLKMRDGISQREEEINRLAYSDPITGLPNRLHFTKTISDVIAKAEKDGTEACVLLMDLDRFKHVNDVLGHSFGDALLKHVGARIGRILGTGEHIARLGGDEFAFVLPRTRVEEAKIVADKMLKALEEPLVIDGHSIDVGAGIGIASYPEHGTSPHVLLSHAEMAMYVAKQSGNEAVAFSKEIDTTAVDSLSLLSDLRRAIDENQFKLYVQPKLSLEHGQVIGVESLVRWIHPLNGMVFPDKFIPFAEKTGFIRIMTLWVLEQSAILAKEMADQGLKCKVSVNISARDLLDQDLPAKFRSIISKHSVSADAFCLEITESTIMDDPVRSQQTLEALHSLGVDLSIDDFGTGYSSLAYLKRLPVDELKIDKSFVMNMEQDADDTKIVRSTIDLGHNMGLRVVAEGVENEATWNLLRNLGCDHAQGYFMSRPMPSENLIHWISSWVPPKV